MKPESLPSLLQAAVAHHQAGRLDQAEAAYRVLRAKWPGNFDVLHLSGWLAYQQARLSQAVDWLSQARQLNPENHVCELHLGAALQAAGRWEAAEECFRRVVSRHPDSAEGWDHLAFLLKTQDRLLDAVLAHEKVVALQPASGRGWYNYGLTLSVLGRHEEALRCHRRAAAAAPDYALARYGQAQALQQLNQIPEAVTHYRAFLAACPGQLEARSYLLYALHNLPGVTREELLAEHLAYGRIVGEAPAQAWRCDLDPERRLRVGFVSADFRAHACAYFVEPLLRGLDRARFEVLLYHDQLVEDAVTERFKGLATVWRKVAGRSSVDVAAQIRADAPDILIDLAGHTGVHNRLPMFARRLALVQITYLGYPDTTGVAAMDYRFTDAVADPEGDADRFATEKLVRFAPTAWAYAPPATAPEPVRRAEAAATPFVFGSCNTPAKLTDEMLLLWGRILAAVPDSRLLIKGAGLGLPGPKAAFEARLRTLGVPGRRVDLMDRTPDVPSHLAVYQNVDVALDSYPYHGTTTTCEALWMGVPVVSREGDRHVARVGASLLRGVGHQEWVASDPQGYFDIAVRLAADRRRLSRIRAALRDDLRRSPLLDHAGQAARFGAAMRECWRSWCRRQTPTG